MAERAIDIWRRKLEHLRCEEAVASDPAQRFTIGEEIKHAERRIAELEGDAPREDPPPETPQPCADPQPPISGSLDEVLHAYSEARLGEWNDAWTNPDDPDRLLYYVPPHYAVVDPELHDAHPPDRRFPKRGPLAAEPLQETHAGAARVTGATEEETLINLLQTSDRLCVSEGPGAGKSIFTRRVQAFLSSQAGREALFSGQPALAVRWEEWDGSWPDDFHVSLARELEPYCQPACQQYRYLYGPQASGAEADRPSEAWTARLLPDAKN